MPKLRALLTGSGPTDVYSRPIGDGVMPNPTISDEFTATAAASWTPGTETERGAVREQLERILAHPYFRSSKRCPIFLRYIVEQALKGETHHKERVLGVQVFGRNPSYDTGTDPIVRITASEVRKRIAQYYHEPGHEGELRIDLPAGCYNPIYQLAHEQTSTEAATSPPDAVQPAVARRSPSSLLKRPYVYMYLALAIVLLVAPIAFVNPSAASNDSRGDLWGPLLQPNSPILLCIGESNSTSPQTAEPNASDFINPGDHVTFLEASAAFRVGKFLTTRGMVTHLRPARAMSLTDLRVSPLVLLGGGDNSWTMRIVQPLRFHFIAQSGQPPTMIEDRSNPSQKDWSINIGGGYSQVTRDYAIVARFSDPTTDQPVVVAAGLGENGTLAAAEFLAESKFTKDLGKVAPAGWKKKNVEIVVATQIVDGQTGPPSILATYFW